MTPNPLAVVVWKWKPAPGADPDRIYTHEHVVNLHAALVRYLPQPWRLHVFTDSITADARLAYLTGTYLYSIPDPTGFKHVRRLQIFNPEVYGSLRMAPTHLLQLDLDIVVLGDLAPLVADNPHALTYHGNNIAVMYWRIGQPAGFWDWYSVNPADRLAQAQAWCGNPKLSDQAVINFYLRSHKISWRSFPPGLLARFPYREGAVAWTPPEGACLVHMYGKRTNPGNPEVQRANPWILEHWKSEGL